MNLIRFFAFILITILIFIALQKLTCICTFNKNDILRLSDNQKSTFLNEEVSNIFPEYYLLKVNQFNDNAKDTLDEWVYFLKNSEVKDNFKAKGLKEAGEVLDIMRLPKDDEYGYNRYLDSLHLKASEIYTLQTEAEFRFKDDMVKKSILKGLDNGTISHTELKSCEIN